MSAAIRYYAGGYPLDIMVSHGIGYNDVYHSVWEMTDAINLCPKLAIKFPTCHAEQSKIANEFKNKSTMGYDNCAGCIDGVLFGQVNQYYMLERSKPRMQEVFL